jgi:hypothetical protein
LGSCTRLHRRQCNSTMWRHLLPCRRQEELIVHVGSIGALRCLRWFALRLGTTRIVRQLIFKNLTLCHVSFLRLPFSFISTFDQRLQGFCFVKLFRLFFFQSTANGCNKCSPFLAGVRSWRCSVAATRNGSTLLWPASHGCRLQSLLILFGNLVRPLSARL